jgi:hypothetical protein
MDTRKPRHPAAMGRPPGSFSRHQLASRQRATTFDQSPAAGQPHATALESASRLPEAVLEKLARGHENTFTARAMTRPTTASEISDWSAMVSFAHTATGITSVGLKAVLVVSPRMR